MDDDGVTGMKRIALILAVCVAAAMAAFSVSQADLINNGDGLIYDTVQNITWYDYQTGPMTYAQAQNWAAGLSVAGVSGWTLPSAGSPPSLGASIQANYNVATGQMGYLFYDELGDQGFFAPNGSLNAPGTYGLVNAGPFQNLTGGNHWMSNVYTPEPQDAWYFGYTDSNFVGAAANQYAWGFDPGAGDQYVLLMTDSTSTAMAVHTGDIKPLVSSPLPSAALLFGPAIGALGAMSAMRRRRARLTVR